MYVIVIHLIVCCFVYMTILYAISYLIKTLYTVFHKNDPYLIAHNFGKC